MNAVRAVRVIAVPAFITAIYIPTTFGCGTLFNVEELTYSDSDIDASGGDAALGDAVTGDVEASQIDTGDCEGGLANCFSQCVDITSNPRHCNACGHECNLGESCASLSGCFCPSIDGGSCYEGLSCSPSGCTGEPNWPMPNPAASPLLPNSATYDTGTTGIVIDKVTGLHWQREVDGQTRSLPDAKIYCSQLSLGSPRLWRVPSRIELVSIVDFTRKAPGPTLDQAAFPNTPAKFYWSSSLLHNNPNIAWGISFNAGYTTSGNIFNAVLVRCVHSPTGNSQKSRFIITTDTAYDSRTKLTWQRSFSPTKLSSFDASAYCTNLGFRLPSINELQTIVDETRESPSFDPMLFPSTPNEMFWSSSMIAADSGKSWCVLGDGSTGESLVSNLQRVRCVR